MAVRASSVSAAMNACLCFSSQAPVKIASNWSTMRYCGAGPAVSPARSAAGVAVGTYSRAVPASRGMSPARSSEDLPDPDGPDHDERQAGRAPGPVPPGRGQPLGHVLAAEEPRGVRSLEAGQAAVGRVAA